MSARLPAQLGWNPNVPLAGVSLMALLTWRGDAAQTDKGIVPLTGEVVGAQEPFLDIVQDLAMHSIRGPLPFQLEY